MADAVAARLAALRLRSPAGSVSLASAFTVSAEAPAGTLPWRVYMAPRDMAALNVSAGAPVVLQLATSGSVEEGSSSAKSAPKSLKIPESQATLRILIAWPSVVLASRTLRITTESAKDLGLSSGALVCVLPADASFLPCASSVTVISANGFARFSPEDILLIGAQLRQMRVVSLDVPYRIFGRDFAISACDPAPGESAGVRACIVNLSTRFLANDPPSMPKSLDVPIGGVDAQLRVLVNVMSPLMLPGENGHSYAKGALLFGPPGTGKTLIARHLAAHFGAHLAVVDGFNESSDIGSTFKADLEARLRTAFQSSSLHARTIVFLDEIDMICARSTESSVRSVAALCSLIDSIKLNEHTFVLAATNAVDAVDVALRRPGRLEIEVEVPVPGSSERLSILNAIVGSIPADMAAGITPVALESVASRSHGFVGADLMLVVKEACALAFKRASDCEHVEMSDDDLERGFLRVKPSSLREVQLEVPQVRWADIGGQEETKQRLRECIEWPLRMPEKFARFGIRPPKGVLLYGPPGCSKTLLAKALATESGLNFLAVRGPELLSKWVGDSERAVREVFRKARAAAPSVIFFDEFDAIGGRRASGGGSAASATDRVLSQLLSELDGIDPLLNVVVVAATNRPDVLDEAILRPGRFDRHVYVALPDDDARKAIFHIHGRKMPIDPAIDVGLFVERTRGFSGAEIAACFMEAGMAALEESENADRIEARHLDGALDMALPRTPADILAIYKRFSLRAG